MTAAPPAPDPAEYDLVVDVRSGRLRVVSAVMVLILVPVIVSVVALLVGLEDAPVTVVAALVLPMVLFLGVVGYVVLQQLRLAADGWVLAASAVGVLVRTGMGYLQAPWALVRGIRQKRGVFGTDVILYLHPEAADPGSGLVTDKSKGTIRRLVRFGVRIDARYVAMSPAQMGEELREIVLKNPPKRRPQP